MVYENNKRVLLGNKFTPQETAKQPTVRFKEAKPQKLYTIRKFMLDVSNCFNITIAVMVDEDEDPDPEKKPKAHWLEFNVPGWNLCIVISIIVDDVNL